MNEFSLIGLYFKRPARSRSDVIYGIGDDAACLHVPADKQLLVSTDTLVAGVHFLEHWDAYDIACKAVRVNISDIAAMGAKPCWLTLALTLPAYDQAWLERFSQGLHESLNQFDIALVGGDTTRGPLSMTITIHGLVPIARGVRRSGARPGDRIYVSGELGAAALAVCFLQDDKVNKTDQRTLMQKLQHPNPRVDLAEILRDCASAAIDISDGLSADLHHICVASGVGASLNFATIPVHSLVKKYKGEKAVEFALTGGDDYELCFTVPAQNEKKLLAALEKFGLSCYSIGSIEDKVGMRMSMDSNELIALDPLGYSHF